MKERKLHARRKLTDEQKIEVVRLYVEEKWNMAQIARKYNLNTNSIRGILIRRGIETRWIADEVRRKYTIDHNYFEKIDTEDKAYFLGLMYADGCNSGKTISTIGLQEEDGEILEKFSFFLKTDKPLQKMPKRRENGKSQLKVTICSKKTCEDLTKLGCMPRKSLILKFPTSDQVPDHLLHHFIRGNFDGDGGICFHKLKSGSFDGIVYFNGSKDFIYKLTDILNPIFNTKNHSPKPHLNIFRYDRRGNGNVKKLYNYLYKDATIYLQRKYDKFQQIINQIPKPKLGPRKAVYQLDKNYNVLNEFVSCTEAATILNFSIRQIGKCVRGEMECYNGYFWKYKVDYLKNL